MNPTRRHRHSNDLSQISRAHAERRLSSLSWQTVQETYRLLGAEDDFAMVARGNIPLIDETTGEDIITRSQQYSRRLGLRVQATAGKGHAFVNGRYFSISDVSDILIAFQGISTKFGLAEPISTNS